MSHMPLVQYTVEAFWHNGLRSTLLLVPCATEQEAARTVARLEGQGHEDSVTGVVAPWTRVTMRPYNPETALRDLGWPSGR
jgi:hypothetical protein